MNLWFKISRYITIMGNSTNCILVYLSFVKVCGLSFVGFVFL